MEEIQDLSKQINFNILHYVIRDILLSFNGTHFFIEL